MAEPEIIAAAANPIISAQGTNASNSLIVMTKNKTINTILISSAFNILPNTDAASLRLLIANLAAINDASVTARPPATADKLAFIPDITKATTATAAVVSNCERNIAPNVLSFAIKPISLSFIFKPTKKS